MERRVVSVSELNRTASLVLENEPLLRNIYVRGEISNFKPAPAGHWYFSLKDRDAAVACAMFTTQQRRVAFRPENGMEVIVSGTVKIYSPQGRYQIACDDMQAINIKGNLSLAYEQLKARLSDEGLFNSEHKKALPAVPAKVGIITSDTGAAVRDMIRILRTRWPMTGVVVLPVRVQGTEAAGEIAYAIRRANELKIADVLIIGRGGGSLEDLWAFNTELVARAVYASDIPVISAVGHEPDVVISDYVADKRASTPSNAAEIVVPDQNDFRQRLDTLYERLALAESQRLEEARGTLARFAENGVLRDVKRVVEIQRLRLEKLLHRLDNGYGSQLREKSSEFSALCAALDAMSPLKVLGRGYSIAIAGNGEIIKSVALLECGTEFSLKVQDGTVRCVVK